MPINKFPFTQEYHYDTLTHSKQSQCYCLFTKPEKLSSNYFTTKKNRSDDLKKKINSTHVIRCSSGGCCTKKNTTLKRNPENQKPT